MATLCIDADSGPRLRDWLQGDWAIVFSHPADFQYHGLESDRWLAILRAEFAARAVRALGFRRDALASEAGWTGDLTGDRTLVRLDGAEASSRALRHELQRSAPRFVMIVDEDLCQRGVLKYSAGRVSVSALDLLASVDAMRRRSVLRIAA
jgi:alkyl hydroperoxide reductase subunit AhpC